jgi:hypothetical protein
MLTTAEKLKLRSNAKTIDTKVYRELNSQSFNSIEPLFTVDESECLREIEKLNHSRSQEYQQEYWSHSLKGILEDVSSQFMIGDVIARNDKEGGSVNTIHNVRKGIYATEDERSKFEALPDYDSNPYHSHRGYRSQNRQSSELQKAGRLTDAYTNQPIPRNAKKELDHTVSAKEIQQDPGRVLAELNGPDLANHPSNLNPTTQPINSSKKDLPMSEFIKSSQNGSRKDKPFAKDIDPEKAMDLDKKSRNEIEAKIRSEYYTSKKFQTQALNEAVKSGGRQYVQTAIGTVLKKSIGILWTETSDFFTSKEFKSKGWKKKLKSRLQNVGQKFVEMDLKTMLHNSLHTFIEGFFTSLITTIINIFVTTAKRVIRLIREGISSLYKAFKFLYSPSEYSREEKYHEFGKILIAGLGVGLGIMIYEAIDTLPFIKAINAIPFIGEAISLSLSSLFTGLLTVILVFLWDRLDLFGVFDKKQHEYVMKKLADEEHRSKEELKSAFEKLIEEDPSAYQLIKADVEFLL